MEYTTDIFWNDSRNVIYVSLLASIYAISTGLDVIGNVS